MSIIKWRPFWPDWDEDFIFPSESTTFSPVVDVYEDKDNVIVESPITGIDPEKINIEIEDNVLKISGKSEHKSEVDEKGYYRKEVRYGSFHRAVALPKVVDADKAEASYEDGLLKITIPKKEEAKPKAVKVKAVKK